MTRVSALRALGGRHVNPDFELRRSDATSKGMIVDVDGRDATAIDRRTSAESSRVAFATPRHARGRRRRTTAIERE